ncbi:calcium-binding protein [Magnetospirillum fulvum]|uniref:Uncharacterized protein n=1 Tax=Magnetospirillum fulvum TaxID=1082 RepID=A0A1H6H790_MAGFU|nr:calcium-binding protein [Magnetospirillum fulvum]SEH29930.1 hypothetical protein SAMN04244559_00835 [Magnetospirillum fulvum]
MAEAQQVKVIESVQGQFRLNLAQSAVARVDIVDIDLVIETKSGERLILAGAALDSTSDKPPGVMFTDGLVSSTQLFALVAQVESPSVPVPAMTSLSEYEAQKTKGPRSFVTSGEPNGEADAASAADSAPPAADVPSDVAPLSSPPPTTVETLLDDAKKQLDGETSKHGDFSSPPQPIPPQSPPSSPPATPGAATTVPQLPTLQVWFGNYSGSETVGSTVYGAGGTTASDPRNFSANAPLAANSSEQIAPEVLTVTGNQTVYVDGVGPLLGTTGSVDANATNYYSKVFVARIVGTFNKAGSMTITGLPLGFSLVSLSAAFTVVNTVAATATSAGVWTITLVDSTEAITSFPLKLIYPTTASASQITLDFAESVYYSGANYDLHQKVVIQVKEVHSAADLDVTAPDPNDSTKTVAVDILPSNGVPNLVYVQGSHNTIYGGIADDTMVSQGAANTFDGGGGINTVDFSGDATSHTINLATNANHGGYAEGSVLTNISVIRAGSGGDTITGNASTSTTIYGGSGNDLMAGGSAGDVFVGGGGRDTVTYAASAAVTVDQTGGGRSSGDALGDSYSGIATLVGSGVADTFIGGTSAGSATMDGNGGSDWVDYTYVSVANNRGVTVNLNDSTANSGGAISDRLVNIENIKGSTGNDLFYASTEANSFVGNGGTDTVSYTGPTAVTIDQVSGRGRGTGAASGDSYNGIATIVGSAGNDTFIGGTASGSAVMDGATGNNWVSYNYTGSSSVTINLSTGTNSGAASNDRLVNVANVYGSDGNDLFIADSRANSFIGGGGVDVVRYDGLTAVTVDQTGGNRGTGAASGDTYGGIATIVGGSGNDIFVGGTASGSATMDGSSGDNWVTYQNATGPVTLDLTGSFANGGAAQYDHLVNVENVAGSSAADLFYADSAVNSFVGGGGQDTVSYAGDSSGGLIIDLTGRGYGSGYASGDSYSGIAAVIGSSGNDTFIGGIGSGLGTMDGATGSDWVDYEFVEVVYGRGVTVDLTDSANNAGGASKDRLLNIENIKGTSGNDLFYASSDTNSFIGNGGTDIVSYARDSSGTLVLDQTGRGQGTSTASGDSYTGIATLVGSAGNDTFIGGTAAGSATMDGAGGTNWISYQYPGSSGVTVNLATGANGGAASNDHFINIENVLGSSGNDTFFADAAANSFVGGGGTDVVSYAGLTAVTVDQTGGNRGTGAASGDTYGGIATILGGSGNDTFVGGTAAGSATMDGAGGSNWVTYQNAAGSATLDLGGGTANGGAALNDRLFNIANIVASSHGDTLTGNGADNSFISGAGADTIDGGSGHDTVDYSADASSHTVNLASNGNHGGKAEGDRLDNIEVVIGGNSGDTLTGNATASTTLIGGTGNDLLAGGSAADYFNGGAGADVVTYDGLGTVTVDQTAGNHGTGAAAGDQYVNVETIVGSSGVDTFVGGTASGSATMDGGGGRDWIDYEYLAVGVGVTVNLASGTTSGAVTTDRFVNIENVYGSVNNDVFIASGLGNTFNGGGGSDWVSYAQNGGIAVTIDLYNHLSSGGASNDSLIAIQNLIGSTNRDTFYADGNTNSFIGGGGADIVSYSNSTVDLIIDQTQSGIATGLARGDGYSGIATIVGGSLSDTFIGGTASGSATMDGSGGENWVSYLNATSGATVNLATGVNAGSALYDHFVNVKNIVASAYGDRLTGDSNNNTFFAGAGADTFTGGGGIDVVSYSQSRDSLVIDQAGYGRGTSAAAGDAYSGIATIIGSTAVDTFIGGTAAGSATMFSGGGSDWINYQYLTGGTGATVDLLNNSNNSGAAANDRTNGIENVIGSAYADLFYADGETNSFIGGTGNDVVSYVRSGVLTGMVIDQTGGGHATGFAGNDYYSSIETISGSQYDDTFIGGTAAVLATMDGGVGSDWVDYQYVTGASGVTVDLTNSLNNGGAAGNDRLTNVENIRGTANADLFYASAAANSFVGNGGTDTVSYARAGSAVTVDQTSGNHGSGYASGDSFDGIATIIGSAAADTFIGGTASVLATMDGATGSDWVDYRYVSGASGVTVDLTDSLNNGGAAVNDRLANVENITGTTNADLFYASSAANSFVGNGGTDIVSYARAGAAVTVDQTSGNHGSGYASGDSFNGIATIVGSTAADTFIGGTGASSATMDGGSGSDWADYRYLSGGVGVTVNLFTHVNGGAASNDKLTSIENVYGSIYSDTFVADGTGNSFVGNGGTDWVSYASLTDTSHGATVDLSNNANNAGSAALDRLSNVENIIGSGGNDKLIGDALNNTFIGGLGSDSFDGGSGGLDVVTYASSTAGLSIDLTGGGYGTLEAQGDSFVRIATIVGSAQADTFMSGTGTASVTMSGGGGTDWVSYQYATGAATIDLTYNGTTSLNGGSALYDHLIGIENVRGSTYNDMVFADSSANSIIGGGGTDIVSYARGTAMTIDLTGGGRSTGYASGDSLSGIATVIGSSGNDTFIGGTATGSSTMSGGGGTDWITYQYATSAATLDLTATSANGGSAQYDHVSGIENVRGSTYSDTFFADSVANSFIGGGGTDIVSYARGSAMTIDLTGGGRSTGFASGDSWSGIATVIGSSGNDTFIGGTATGSSTMAGGGGTDWITYQYATSAATLDLTATSANGGSAQYDHVSGIENVRGSTYNDTFFADSVANSFIGGGGTDIVSYARTAAATVIDQTSGNHGSGYASGDTYSGIATIIGGTGNDTFIGGTASGSATMSGGGGTDWVSYQYATSGATVDLTYNNTTSLNSGSAANDHLIGIKSIRGSAYNDTFYADSNANSFIGGGGTDIVSYAHGTAMTINLGGTNRSTGLASGDSYSGIATVIGSSGGDTFIGGTSSGSAVMSGGGGTDWVTYQYATGGKATVNLATGSNGGTAANDRLSGVENIVASNQGDVLTGNGNANSFISGGGADTIDGGSGIDTVSYTFNSGTVHTINLANNAANSGGYAAGDVLSNIEVVIGGNSGDTITGNSSSTTTIIGGTGNDLFFGGSVGDSFSGGNGTDTVSYNNDSSGVGLTISLTNTANSSGYAQGDSYTSIETIIGTGFDDTFIGGTASGSATMDGAVGSDWISYAGLAAATVSLGGGTNAGSAQYDKLVNIENILGSGNADVLTGSTATNTINAGAGDDTIFGSGGSDSIDGGVGSHDIIDYSVNAAGAANDRAVTVYLGGFDEVGNNSSSHSVTMPAGYTGYGLNDLAVANTVVADYYANIEDVRGGGGNDILIGTTGINTIYGGSGNDTLGGGGGGDRLDGGGGTDTVTYAWESFGVSVYLGGTTQTGAAVGGLSLPTGYTGGGFDNGKVDYYASIENVVGSANKDFIVGSSGDNVITGYGGADTIYGMGGNDTIFGGLGSESIDGGSGTDTINYSTASGGVSVDLNLATNNATSIGGVSFTDTLVSIENIVGSTSGNNVLGGNTFNNTIWGGTGSDTLWGGGGTADVLYGGTGNDTFFGGVGTETLNGEIGNDTVDYSSSTSGISIDLTTGVGINLGGTTFHDTLVSIEAITGSNQGDQISGNGTNRNIHGGGGDDTFTLSGIGSLDGGAGIDSLIYTGSDYGPLFFNVTNIESVDIRNGNHGDGYSVSSESIVNILGSSSSRTLDFTIDTGDSFTLSSGGGQDVVHTGNTYTIYSDNSHATQLAQLQLHQG